MSPPPASILERWLGWLCTGLRHMAILHVRIQRPSHVEKILFRILHSSLNFGSVRLPSSSLKKI